MSVKCNDSPSEVFVFVEIVKRVSAIKKKKKKKKTGKETQSKIHQSSPKPDNVFCLQAHKRILTVSRTRESRLLVAQIVSAPTTLASRSRTESVWEEKGMGTSLSLSCPVCQSFFWHYHTLPGTKFQPSIHPRKPPRAGRTAEKAQWLT